MTVYWNSAHLCVFQVAYLNRQLPCADTIFWCWYLPQNMMANNTYIPVTIQLYASKFYKRITQMLSGHTVIPISISMELKRRQQITNYLNTSMQTIQSVGQPFSRYEYYPPPQPTRPQCMCWQHDYDRLYANTYYIIQQHITDSNLIIWVSQCSLLGKQALKCTFKRSPMKVGWGQSVMMLPFSHIHWF